MPSAASDSLAGERTALGWQRAALSLGVVAALMLRHARPFDVAAGLLLGAAACVVYGRRVGTRELCAITVAGAIVSVLIVLGV